MKEKFFIASLVLVFGFLTFSLYQILIDETQQDVVILSSIYSKKQTQGIFYDNSCFGTVSSEIQTVSSEDNQILVEGILSIPILNTVSIKGSLALNGLKQVGASEFSGEAGKFKLIFGTLGVHPIKFIFRNGAFKKEIDLPGPITLRGSKEPFSLIAPFKKTIGDKKSLFTFDSLDKCTEIKPLLIDLSRYGVGGEQ